MKDTFKIYAKKLEDESIFGRYKGFLPGIYLHGKLHEQNGYDIVVCAKKDEKPLLSEDTVEMVDVIFADGTTHKAFAYLWKSPAKYKFFSRFAGDIDIPVADELAQQHGLICDCEDKKANQEALEKFNARVDHI